MDRVRIIEYKGKKIILSRYGGLSPDEIIEVFREANTLTFRQTGEIFALADFTDAFVDSKTLSYLKNEESIRAAKFYSRSAAVGVSGIKNLFLNIYNSITGNHARAFNSVEEAKEWLISGDPDN